MTLVETATERLVRSLVEDAVDRCHADIRRSLPLSARRFIDSRNLIVWPSRIAEPRHFPVFFLPIWIAPDSVGDDRQFHADMAYSTLNGLCFVRLVDGATDGDVPISELRLLPASAYFHARFQEQYHKYFPAGSTFWEYFTRLWCGQADVTVADAHFEDVSADRFRDVTSRKTMGALVPLTATALRFDRESSIGDWEPFVRQLGLISQMTNDLASCVRDYSSNANTFLLSQFRREARPAESLPEWLLREGFAWASSLLEDWASELWTIANGLDCPSLEQWVVRRRENLQTQLDSILHRPCG